MDDKVIDATLSEWAAALETDMEGLQKQFAEFLADERALHPQLSAEQLVERALRRTRIRAKREHGPLAFISGTADAVILGVSGLIDSSQKLKEEALQVYRENPKAAIKLGVVDAKGTPMDTRRVFPGTGKPNPFFGRPLRDRNLIQIVTGLASFEVEEQKTKPAPFTAIIDRNAADSVQMPVFHRIRFPISGYSEDEASKMLRVNVPRGYVFEDLGPVDVATLIQKYAPSMLVPLEQLDEWCNSHGQRELVAVEGDVVRMDLVPHESTRNRRLQIDNGHDIKGYGTTIWVPETVPIDFAEESRVLVFGNARAGNPESGFGASVNGMGLFAFEEYKVPLPEGLPQMSVPAGPLPVPESGISPEMLARLGQRADEVFGTPKAQPPVARSADRDAFVFVTIKMQQGIEGVKLDLLRGAAEKAHLQAADVEAALNALLDAGRIYESRLGTFKALEEVSKEDTAAWKKLGGV